MNNFVNKSRYGVLAVKVDNDDDRRIQELCFDNGIYWKGDTERTYTDINGYIYINLLKGIMMWSTDLDLLYLSGFKWNRIEYTIDDYYKIERILKFGEVPNYKPKKRLMESFDIKNYPYREIGFEVDTKEDVIKVISFFYDNYNVENRNKKDEIIKEIFETFYMRNTYRVLTIDFKLDSFDIIDKLYMEHKVLYGFDPVLYTVDDLIKFQVVPNYKPKKRILENVDTDVLKTKYFNKYSSFITIFDTDIEAKEFEKIRLLLIDKFNIKLRDNILDDIYSHCTENQFYIVIRIEDDYINWAWGKISHLDTYNKKENYSKVYTIDEINTENKINNILNLREILPIKDMYKPRKRILESVKQNQYRFKTEEEFKEEYGPNWRYKVMGNGMFATEMDYLLGTDLEFDFPDDMDEILISRNDSSITFNSIEDIPRGYEVWYIVRQFITKKKSITPNYKPRRFKDF